MGGMITKFVWVCCRLPVSSPEVSRSSLVDETPGEGFIQSNCFSRFILRQIRGVQRKPLLALAVSPLPTAQNNHYPKVAYFATFHSLHQKFIL